MDLYPWTAVKFMIYGTTFAAMAFAISKCTGSVS